MGNVFRWRRSNFRNTKNKFGAKRVSHKGYSFASKLEAAVFDILKERELTGEIDDLRCQHVVYMTDAEISWRVDFSFTKDGQLHFAEAKGQEFADYLIKKKLWRYYGHGPLEIWKGNYKYPRIVETIIPKIS